MQEKEKTAFLRVWCQPLTNKGSIYSGKPARYTQYPLFSGYAVDPLLKQGPVFALENRPPVFNQQLGLKTAAGSLDGTASLRPGPGLPLRFDPRGIRRKLPKKIPGSPEMRDESLGVSRNLGGFKVVGSPKDPPFFSATGS